MIPIHPPLPWHACFFHKQLIQSLLIRQFSVIPYLLCSLVWLKSHLMVWHLLSNESPFTPSKLYLILTSFPSVWMLNDWEIPNHSSGPASKYHLPCEGSIDLISSGKREWNFTLIASCIFLGAKYASVIGLMWRLNKIIHVKDSTECLAHRKCSTKCIIRVVPL